MIPEEDYNNSMRKLCSKREVLRKRAKMIESNIKREIHPRKKALEQNRLLRAKRDIRMMDYKIYSYTLEHGPGTVDKRNSKKQLFHKEPTIPNI